MRFIDEYRDAEAARRYAEAIARQTTQELDHHGGLRRTDPCDREIWCR